MKCPDPDCGWSGDGKFCQDCGLKLNMVPSNPSSIVVVCSGTNEDGSTCGVELDRSKKFCSNCGAKVDKALFDEPVIKKCPSCNWKLGTKEKFCPECGLRQTDEAPLAPEASQSSAASSQSPLQTPTCEVPTAVAPSSAPAMIAPGNAKPTGTGAEDTKDEDFESSSLTAQPTAAQEQENNAMDHPNDDNQYNENVSNQSTAALEGQRLHSIGAVLERLKNTETQANPPSGDSIDVNDEATGVKMKMLPTKSEDMDQGSGLPSKPGTKDCTKPDDNGHTVLDTDAVGDTQSPEANMKEESLKRSFNTMQLSGNTDGVSEANDQSMDKLDQDREDEDDRMESEGSDVEDSDDGTKSIHDNDDASSVGSRTDMAERLNDGRQGKGNRSKKKKRDKKKARKARRHNEIHSLPPADPVTQQYVEPREKRKKSQDKKDSVPIPANNEQTNVNKGEGSSVHPRDSQQDINAGGSNSGAFSQGSAQPSSYSTAGQTDALKVFGQSNNEKKSFNDDTNTHESETSKSSLFPDSKPSDSKTSVDRNPASTASSKPEKENKNKTDKAKAEEDKNKTKKPQTSGSSKINVVFHILVSKEMIDDPSDKVVIRFGDAEFGGWKNRERVMKRVRNLEDFAEYEYKLEMAKYLLSSSHFPRQYKYCVLKENDELWENYHTERKIGKYHNRTLDVEQHFQIWKRGVWHQYDGIVTPEQTSGVKQFFKRKIDYISGKYEKECEKYATEFAVEFCPPLFRPECYDAPLDESLDQMECLIAGLKKVYKTDAKCWKTDDKYKTQVFGDLFSNAIKSLSKAGSSRQKTFYKALSIAIAIHRLQIELTSHHYATLCQFLLLTPDKEHDTFLEQEMLNNLPKDTVKKALIALSRSVLKSGKDPIWMLCLPVLHVVYGVCKPFAEAQVDLTYDYDKPTWWGIADSHVKKLVDEFKEKTGEWQRPLDDILAKLHPLIEMDFYLPRSFAACLQVSDIVFVIKDERISIDAACATVLHWIKTTNPVKTWYQYSYGYYIQYSDHEKTADNCLLNLMERVQNHCCSGKEFGEVWSMAYQISQKIVELVLDLDTVDRLKLSRSIQLFLHCIAVYDNIKGRKARPDTRQQTAHRDSLSYIFDKLGRFLNLCLKYDWGLNMHNYLQWWNGVFVKELRTGIVGKTWNELVAKELTMTLQTKVLRSYSQTLTVFIEHYCGKIDGYCTALQDVLTKTAFQAIEYGGYYNATSLDESQKKKFGGLLSDVFEKKWQSSAQGSATKTFDMMLSWGPITQFIERYMEDKHGSILSEKCEENLELGISLIDSQREELSNGNISVGLLNKIHSNMDAFADIVQCIDKQNPRARDYVVKMIQVRLKEVESFQHEVSLMTVFVQQCQHVKSVETSQIDAKLRVAANINDHRITDFCIPVALTPEVQIEKLELKITAFRGFESVLEMAKLLEEKKNSYAFQKMWQEQCKREGTSCSSPDDVVKNIWKPISKRLTDFSENLRSGNIAFERVEHIFGHFMDNKKFEELLQEMLSIGIPEETGTRRIKQMKEKRQVQSCVEGATIILDFRNQFGLEGDFKPISDIAENTKTTYKMKDFDDKMITTCGFLRELHQDRVECLQTFVECKDLVDWLKESMQSSGQKELKVFVDLAMMSAGDEPLNIARVRCLHSAVIGYSKLIFDLQPDSDYNEFLNACKEVWQWLSANPDLPKQLRDTNQHLKWLKEIKKAHGSVEVTSLMQAEAINCDGVFSLGRHVWKSHGKSTPELHNMTVKDIVKLTVPPQKDKRELKNYTFTQIQDLQSRLMLVAGKGETRNINVERFTMIFDCVIRLSTVYSELCLSGCVLFNNLTTTFLCSQDPKRPVCAVLQFDQGENIPEIKGRTSKDEQLEQMLPEIARFMEGCHAEWLRYINDRRKEYFHLNYFTISQLVILQRELVKFGTEEEPSLLIYPLLSAVKENCSPDDLSSAWLTAKQEVDGILEQEQETMESETEEIDTEEKGEERRQTFIKQLVESGYSEHLARQACEHVDPEDIVNGDITSAIVWCMGQDNTDEIDSVEPVQAERTITQENIPFSTWSDSSTSISSIIKDITSVSSKGKYGVGPLIQELKTLWRAFLDSISSNIRDYLSLEHLGIILKHLAKIDERSIHRSLPPGYKEGEPNLIICPADDVLKTTLSLYSDDSQQPLPQSDEVLVCTPNTTKDEVDIFWRRAIFDPGRKLHCLAYADLLGFNVSEAAEMSLESYLQDIHHNKEQKYRLFVICSSDNENKSSIASFLDKFTRHALPTNQVKIHTYVTEKLKQPATILGVKPAACVDPDRLSARLIRSTRAGVGKTLYVGRRYTPLPTLNGQNKHVHVGHVTIPLQEKYLNLDYITKRLLDCATRPEIVTTRIFHIDISHEVQEGIDYFLFNLLLLNCLVDRSGFVWRRRTTDLYLVETMPIVTEASRNADRDTRYVHSIFSLLPDILCRAPLESMNIYSGHKPTDYKQTDQLFDVAEFRSAKFQRPFQYLLRLDQNRKLDDIKPNEFEETPHRCLQIFLRHCGVNDPSWSELHHFVWFLNTQLVDFEQNQFVTVAANEDLPGFAKFVLRFLMQMSRDFSTRSLNMSEDSHGMRAVAAMDDGDEENDDDDGVLRRYQMRRTWESSPHPYLFFNSDRFTFTFLGFFIERGSGNLVDSQTRRLLEERILERNLYDALLRNHVPMQENFDDLPRDQKILKLCMVMGLTMPHDPDDTYELTTDNVKKIMAIYMRFRCDIPVIIMGETGCGKTRLIKFMCALQSPPGVNVNNMILMKVHGGTTNEDIKRKVADAEEIARKNLVEHGRHMYTVLFFDEANTTESIGLIKEIMCDKSIEGRRLQVCDNLKMVAACNPYRKHSDELIQKLEHAGLGYHVKADETTDKLGRVPMRQLVYRVQPLPQSLLPLVWDFGQLDSQVEDLYIRQMVRRYIRDDRLPDIPNLIVVISRILTESQDYMRSQKNECSFVSLRDVDRVLTVMSWFWELADGDRVLFNAMNERLYNESGEQQPINEEEEEFELEDEDPVRQAETVSDITRSLILALGICYHACLKDRDHYRQHIAKLFQNPCLLPRGAKTIREEIECCQDVFLDSVSLEKNIAKNMALKENVFMMVVCIELRIPLFLVGKPGSSKSLAKTIVSDAMQGNSAKFDLFKTLKQAQMVSFQCSPLSTPDGIVGTFRQCAEFQRDKDLESFVSIVVLDEVGLAEDSPRMPLKTLHPLLEDGCQGDETPEKHKKVAFIGISNWALDPAKMNRGILVQREVPDIEELQSSANGICQTSQKLESFIGPLIKPLSLAYLDIFKEASAQKREFFGLRDFYSLVKMVYAFVEKSNQGPTWYEMEHAIRRNFGGLDLVDPVMMFRKHLTPVINSNAGKKLRDPGCSPSELIKACLFDINKMESESRYLLLLTENYGALSIIQQEILEKGNEIRPIIIFGSSFRKDQEYTQVCRNINKIKVCMETGNTVVLLNLENLYESLYDALNQYYVYFGGERYVDLGLGTHRVKCPVHKNFRLIVVAEKKTVYDKFPIPLINRLEKHFLNINTMLGEREKQLVKELEQWARDFAKNNGNSPHINRQKTATRVGDVFIGYHDDTCSAIVLHVTGRRPEESNEQILRESKRILLWCAAPESIVRLKNTSLPPHEQDYLRKCYDEQQAHDRFMSYLTHKLETSGSHFFAQVTTHSKLLAGNYRGEISRTTGISVNNILLVETLSSFDTEQQFSNRIQQHLQNVGNVPSLMIIQCDSGDVNTNLIASARYCVMDEFQKICDQLLSNVYIIFVVQLPRKKGGCFTGFQCGIWHSAHIDDLCPEEGVLPPTGELSGKSVSNIFRQFPTSGRRPLTEHTRGNEMEWAPEDGSGKSSPELEAGLSIEEQPMEAEVGAQVGVLATSDISLEFPQQPVGSGSASTLGNSHERMSSVNVDGIILKCVQSALAKVKDKAENGYRETERVKLVLNCLDETKSNENAKVFIGGLRRLIHRLLCEKEQGDYRASFWMEHEAASHESITKAGTFGRSCLHTLVAKVSPVLAGIIAYLDTNQNLDLLPLGSPWKKMFWLAFMNTEKAVSIQYTDLQSPMRKSDLDEAIVLTTGCEGHSFKAEIPFSWIIIEMIAEILNQQLPDNEHEKMVGEREDDFEHKPRAYADILNQSVYGGLLNQLTREHCGDMESQNEFLQAFLTDYIHDFIHTNYHPTAEDELQVVHQSLTFKTVQHRRAADCEGNLLMSIICVHLAYRDLALLLSHFHNMNVVWPHCSSAILEMKGKNPDHYMFEEHEFTFSALCLLIESLKPKSKELDDEKGRKRWLANVHAFRPVVEKVLALDTEDPKLYGIHSHRSVERAKMAWSRVIVVKLFIEDVCVTSTEDKFTIKNCMPLWMLLKDDVSMKEASSLDAVERFLRLCNDQALRHYMGAIAKCCLCESKLEGPPLCLPCPDKHQVCDRCVNEMNALQQRECPKCKNPFEEDWKPIETTDKADQTDKLRQYQRRCNTFFMDIVSQLCFADDTPPADAVVKKLLDYITCASSNKNKHFTKEMTILKTGIDPNPVFRSFLLQLLLKSSEEAVHANLQIYLDKAMSIMGQSIMGQHYDTDLIELCLLVIQCLEDILIQKNVGTKQQKYEAALVSLNHAMEYNAIEEITVEKLYGLAHARAGLATTALCIAEIVKNQLDAFHITRPARKLLEQAQVFCENSVTKWSKIYLVKYMCRCFGIDIYQTACQSQLPCLRWVSMKELNKDQNLEVCDRYVVTGDSYIQVREALTKVILGEDISVLAEQLQGMHTAGGRAEYCLQLAIHREISCANYRPAQQRKGTKETIQALARFVQTCEIVQDRDRLGILLGNAIEPAHLQCRERLSLQDQGLQCLLVHFMSVMARFTGNRNIMSPLCTLIRTPQHAQNMLLPTMPQDDLEDVRNALLANRGGENPVLYRCPNGHPYVIGDCGRPATTAHCKECGTQIGGSGHVPLPGNVKADNEDRTQTGHILGQPARRGPPIPQRELTPTSCAVVRLLLHMAMFTGSARHTQAICDMIRPNIVVNGVTEFLWNHLKTDIADLQTLLNRSADDIILICHIVLNNILRIHNDGSGRKRHASKSICATSKRQKVLLTLEKRLDSINQCNDGDSIPKGSYEQRTPLREDVFGLQTKQGRKHWENQFCQMFLQTIFQDIDGQLKRYNQQMARDNRLGANPLLCMLYETETHAPHETPEQLQEIPRVWRYRTPITLEHMRQTFEDLHGTQPPQRLSVFALFLKEDHVLQALQYVPRILRLQRILIQRFNRKLDKAEGNTYTLGQAVNDEVAGPETRALFEDFARVWNLIRGHLSTYSCQTEDGGATAPREYTSRPIDDKTPLSVLLPTRKEAGLCSYALLDFLYRRQNDFLRKYHAITRSGKGLSSVPPSAVTSAHLISYDREHDILPLILANCQYTFEMGKGTRIEYDFAGIQRQLMDRFLFSKTPIDIGRVLQIEEMVYRSEFTDAAVFEKLSGKIPQVGLSGAERKQIGDELRSLPDLCRSLDNLDIAISFLKTTGGRPDSNLFAFMTETLHMQSPMASQKAQQTCQLQHARALWLLLSHQKSKLFIEAFNQNSMEIFETLMEPYHEELPEEMQAAFVEYMRTLSVDRLSQVLEVLHEFLVLCVAKRDNREDEDYVDTTNYKLGEALYAYVDMMDFPMLDVDIIVPFPPEILYKHGVKTWIEAYKTLKRKMGGRR